MKIGVIHSLKIAELLIVGVCNIIGGWKVYFNVWEHYCEHFMNDIL